MSVVYAVTLNMATRILPSLLLTAVLLLPGCGAKYKVSNNVYRQLRPGMTLREVNLRIGHPGRRVSTSEGAKDQIAPNPGEIVYIWQNKDGSHVDAAFRGDIMVAAHASGLGLILAGPVSDVRNRSKPVASVAP